MNNEPTKGPRIMVTADADTMIELRGVTKSYGAKRVLTGLNLSVPKGSVLGLLGTNGSGKTTLIKCALGLIQPQSGDARLLGESAWTLSGEAKMRLGYVPQVINLYQWMKVRHLIEYTSAFYANWNYELAERLVREWSIPLEDRIGPLSVGQLQKLAILLAVAHDPDLLILDEPAASLDPLARRQFLQMIIDLAEPGKRTVLFSTHITSDLERVADSVAILKDGRIAWHGLIEDLKDQTHVSLEDSFLEMYKSGDSETPGGGDGESHKAGDSP
jgi:ABC-2 type transport system ATP-binding protein